MTLPVTRKKLGCTNQLKATMATRCLSSILKRSSQSAVRFFSIRSQMLDLKNMMKKISEVAGLSTIYTNHSIRVTAITLWSNAGVPNRHIMSISGHRNEQSLAHYNSRPSISQLQNCSDVLSRAALAVTEASYTTSYLILSYLLSQYNPQSVLAVLHNKKEIMLLQILQAKWLHFLKIAAFKTCNSSLIRRKTTPNLTNCLSR